ncbi:SRPBCC family protein [Nocardioides sp.]|uniref:SRPBCC family protein n=1 Tax=Nocardioides sp. TaxID=35761 RepID=UPI00351281AA
MKVEAVGAAHVDEVWRRYTCPELWSQWAPQIRRVTVEGRAGDQPIEAGVRGVVHGPGLVRIPFEIVDVDQRTRRWTWRVGVGPASITMDHGVDPVAGGHGSRAWVKLHLPLPLAAGYAPVARWALRRAVR